MASMILIDGSSYLYRAFHALPPLTNADGEPTGALFGVVNMLRTTLKAGADYVAFVQDASGPTFRNEMYEKYKANRPPMPDDLRSQIEPMLTIVEAQGIPLLRVPGVEADDVIGTLARQAADQGIEVVISTGDKDFAQLVDEHVTLVNTMTNTRTDETGVKEKFGVAPGRIVDFLALTGDKVDNVPGVDKCGPKTAAKWLDQYGTLAALMEHADEVGGKIGENLRAALDHLPLSRDLVTIKTDVELDLGPTDLTLREADVERLRELYARYEFRAALKDLDNRNDDEEPAPTATRDPAASTLKNTVEAAADEDLSGPGNYELVTTREQLDAWVKRIEKADLVAFDTETTSLDPMRAQVVGVSLAVEPGTAAYIPVAHDYPGAPQQLGRDEVLTALKPVLEDPDRPKLAQHGKYDINVLAGHGVNVRGLAHDTMLESYVWNATATRHDMDSLAARYLGYTTTKYSDVAGKGAKQIGFAEVDLDTARDYAAEDADITLRLHHALWPKLESEPGLKAVYDRHRDPAGAGAGAHGKARRADRRGHPQAPEPGAGQAYGRDPEKSLRGGRPRVQPGLAQAAAGDPVRRAGAAGQGQDRQGRALDQRGGAGGHRRRTPAAAPDPGLPRPGQAALDLHRQAARDGQPRHRPRAHQLPPGRGGDRTAVLVRPQPAEHPGAHRGGPAHPPGLRGTRRLGGDGRRLFADRAAHHGPPVRRRGPAQGLQAKAPTSTEPPPPRCSASSPTTSNPTSAAPPRPSISA